MSKEIYISSTPHETRLAIVENDALTEMYYERENEYTLAGSIYNGKVTRVLPGMQSSFVDIGLDRDAFLYITDFMEEAGDAADFESNASGADRGAAPREGARLEAGRGDGWRSGNDRGDRGDRSARGERSERNGQDRNGQDRNGQDRTGQDRNGQGRTAAEPLNGAGGREAGQQEPSDSELFTRAVSGLDPVRPVSGSERGGSRRGGRNRGDRNSDGTPRRDRGPERVSGNRIEPLPRADGNTEAPASFISEPSAAENSGDLGEGAPGADGSRRWRGRRGRRGSRSEAPQINETPLGVSSEDTEAASIQPARALPDAYADEVAPEASEGRSESASGMEERSSREDHGGGRGGRDRAPRDDRGNRGDRAGQAPRVPRGFAPKTSLYQVDGAADAATYGEETDAAPPEPVILPGESLSKYRAGGSEAAAVAPSATSAGTTSEFVVSGWDGGMVLPGETIRPRGPRPDAGSAVGRESSAGDERRDGRGARGDDRSGRGGRDSRGRERGRDGHSDRGDRGPRAEPEFRRAEPRTVEAEDQSAAAVVPDRAEPVETSIPPYFAESVAVTESQPEPPINSTFVPPPPMPTEMLQRLEAKVENEYEPAEASASYRVDPVAPSEFRQPVQVVEEQTVRETVRPATGADAQDHATEGEGAAPTEHQLTSIFATGEMHSEAVEMTTQDLVAPSPSAQGPQESMEPLSAEIAAGDQSLPYFAPGAGLLEEEMLEDEEESEAAQLPTLQAGGEHEEETLEGAADLGTMIREMSIDRTTRGEAAAPGEGDDFLEEDQDFEEFEEDGEETEFARDGSAEGEAEEEEDESALELEQAAYGSAFEAEPMQEQAREDDAAGATMEVRDPRRDGRSGDRGRRDGRRGDRGGRSSFGDRGSRGSSGSSGDRDRGRGRQSMQATNLPAISDLLKPGQEVLVQIAKEPIAKKGARITSHIALPGRFLVFMPTVHHTGVSRKIESDAERRRLKEILLSEKGEAAGGFIVRTAASGATEEELRSDLRFLLNLWADIKNRSESSKSPALIYHDLNLVERVLRDQVTDTFSAIWVDTETEYERVLRFLQRFQPSLIRRVKLYTKETPLFEQFGITEEINKALRSKVWLKSGGSIVINQTEALVAIDINTGKFVGKTARLEDTIVKTNLDAIPEIVRQIRLRDLGGIIIIDFIDMDDRKNRNRVMAALEDELKSDRAPSKVLPFNDFGLIAITRKRVKQSLERTLSTTCGVCQGTGMVKSPVTVCNDIYIEMRKMHKHLDRGDVMLRVHPEVVKQLKTTSSRWLQEMEEMVGKTILVKSDPSLHPEQFDLH